jgi:hypothetical protein
MNFSVLDPSVSDHHDISPVSTDITRQNNEAIPDGMHGMAECLPFSSGNNPILSKMTMGSESARLAKT